MAVGCTLSCCFVMADIVHQLGPIHECERRVLSYVLQKGFSLAAAGERRLCFGFETCATNLVGVATYVRSFPSRGLSAGRGAPRSMRLTRLPLSNYTTYVMSNFPDDNYLQQSHHRLLSAFLFKPSDPACPEARKSTNEGTVSPLNERSFPTINFHLEPFSDRRYLAPWLFPNAPLLFS